jgi:hypothetical protein
MLHHFVMGAAGQAVLLFSSFSDCRIIAERLLSWSDLRPIGGQQHLVSWLEKRVQRLKMALLR